MLVKTEDGFQPAPVQHAHYVWDQPLHPEREKDAVTEGAPAHESPPTGDNGSGHNGNGYRSVLANGHAAASAVPVPAPTQTPVPAPERAQPAEPPPPAAAAPAVPAGPAREETVSISKKAVAVAVAIAIGLPLGSKALSLSNGEREAARVPAAAAPAAPAPIAAVRSGFMPISGDAVRYAVVIRNPNRALTARAVSVMVSFLDARGRVIGSDVERIPAMYPGATAIAGTTDADGRVARVAVRISSDGYVEGPTKPFTVHSVRLSRRGGALVVRAALSGQRAVKRARVVAVHLNAKGAVVGGDVAYVDIPRAPSTSRAAISTSGVGSHVRRVDVYVLAPR